MKPNFKIKKTSSYLVIFQTELSEAFDIYDSRLKTGSELKEMIEKIKKYEYPVEVPYGSMFGVGGYAKQCGIFFYDSNSIFKSLTITEVSKEEREFIKKLGLDKFGPCPNW
jgi:hypothetical protein